MALAGLFQNIGVDDAAEAKAVIDKILNQRTSELTPKQQGMLGTGIYRDISEQLDVKDAAGNQITRTSKVALPSGQIVESRHQPKVSATTRPRGPGSQMYADIYGDPWWDFFGPLYPDFSFIFTEGGPLEDLQKIVNRALNAETAEEAAEILAPLYNIPVGDIIDALKGPGGRFYDPEETPDQSNESEGDVSEGDDVETVDPNESDPDLSGTEAQNKLIADNYLRLANEFLANPASIKAMTTKIATGTPFDEALNTLLQEMLLAGGGIGVEIVGKDFENLLISIPGLNLPAILGAGINKIPLKNPDGTYKTPGQVFGSIGETIGEGLKKLNQYLKIYLKK